MLLGKQYILQFKKKKSDSDFWLENTYSKYITLNHLTDYSKLMSI